MRRARIAGFSLVDGMVAILVFGLMTLLAGPLFYRMVSDHRVVAFSNELVGQLTKARHVALYEGTSVSLCSSSDGRHCTDTPWTQGYILFTDDGTTGVVDGSDRVLRTVTAASSRRLRVTLSGTRLVRFQRNGTLVADAGKKPTSMAVAVLPKPSFLATLSPISSAHAADMILDEAAVSLPRFTVCSGPAGRAISLNRMGRVTTNPTSCN